jgi:hypothetical protein
MENFLPGEIDQPKAPVPSSYEWARNARHERKKPHFNGKQLEMQIAMMKKIPSRDEGRDGEERVELSINIYEGTGDGWPEKATILAATRFSVVSCLFGRSDSNTWNVFSVLARAGTEKEFLTDVSRDGTMKFSFQWAICRSRITRKKIKWNSSASRFRLLLPKNAIQIALAALSARG